MSATVEDSSSSKSNSPMSATEEDSSSPKSKSPMSATDEDSSSSKSKSSMFSTDEDSSSSKSKAIGTEGGVEEDSDEDDYPSDADTEEILDYLLRNDPRQALSDDDFYDPGRRAMTDEERSAYAKQVRDSEGFDIDRPPAGVRPSAGSIRPYSNIDDCCRRFTEFAIQRQTSYENRELKLKRIIKWNRELGSPVNYYITFDAEDVNTGKVETYQTKVKRMIPEEETELAIFRLKPQPASPTEG